MEQNLELAVRETKPNGNDIYVVEPRQHCENTAGCVISIDEYKLRLILLSVIKPSKDWIGPLGIMVAVGVTFPSLGPAGALGLAKETWQALLALGFMSSLGWLIHVLWTHRKAVTVDEVIATIKGQTPHPQG